MKTKTFIAAALVAMSMSAKAESYGPYNQQYTMNQQFGSTNWYSSPLGMGVAQAGVTLIGGLVNAMSRPNPVVVQQQQPVYVNRGGAYNGGGGQPYYPSNGTSPQQQYYNGAQTAQNAQTYNSMNQYQEINYPQGPYVPYCQPVPMRDQYGNPMVEQTCR